MGCCGRDDRAGRGMTERETGCGRDPGPTVGVRAFRRLLR
jgi:hypothetical protein